MSDANNQNQDQDQDPAPGQSIYDILTRGTDPRKLKPKPFLDLDEFPEGYVRAKSNSILMSVTASASDHQGIMISPIRSYKGVGKSRSKETAKSVTFDVQPRPGPSRKPDEVQPRPEPSRKPDEVQPRPGPSTRPDGAVEPRPGPSKQPDGAVEPRPGPSTQPDEVEPLPGPSTQPDGAVEPLPGPSTRPDGAGSFGRGVLGVDSIRSMISAQSSEISKFAAKSSAAVAAFRARNKDAAANAAATPLWDSKHGAVPGKDHPTSREIPDIPGVNGKYYNSFMYTLNEAWKFIQASPGSIATISVKLRQVFRGAEDVFSVTLYLITKCNDFTDNPNTPALTLHVMNVFKLWLSEGEVSHHQLAYLNSDLKHLAFSIVTMQKIPELNAIVCEVYKFAENRVEFFTPIQELCTWGLYRQACQFALLLNFFTEFDIHAFVVPLILQGRERSTYPWLLRNKKAQGELLATLRSYVSMEYTNKALKLYVRVEKIRLVKVENLYPQVLSKLITQFEEKFNEVPGRPSTAPSKKSVSWKIEAVTPSTLAIRNSERLERVRPTSADSTLEQVTRALRYIKIQQTKSATKVAAPKDSKKEIVAVSRPKTTTSNSEPSSARQAKSTDTLKSAEFIDEPYKFKESPYYSISNMPYFNYLQTPNGFRLFLTIIKEAQATQLARGGPGSDILVVSFDVKWIPPVEKPLPSILVVLLDHEVYLLDIIRLQSYKKERETIWKAMFEDFFNNRGILKLGFGAERIYRGLLATCSGWIEVKHNLVTCLDLSFTAKMIMDAESSFFPFISGVSVLGYGFSELVRICTGKPMETGEHNSNWGDRPLRDAQIVHLITEVTAGMDIFGYMRKRSWFLQFDFEKLITGLVNFHPAGVPISKRRAKAIPAQVPRHSKITLFGNPFRILQSPVDIKIVCDKMFTALAKELRLCGIDTLVLDSEDPHSECVRVASRDGRFIITNTKFRQQMIEFIPPAFCFAIRDEKKPVSHQVDRVFRHFNVRTEENFIFTRCLDCNGNTFIPIGSEIMAELMKSDERPTPLYAGSSVIFISLKSYTDEERAAKNWTLISADKILEKPGNCHTYSGAPIHFDGITNALLKAARLVFLVCDACGRVYCEGSPYYVPPGIMKQHGI